MSKTLEVALNSLSPYSQSRPHCEARLSKETADAYEARTWHHRLHLKDGQGGQVVMPAMAFRNVLAEAAKYLSLQIPGKGKSTYTKHFESGLLVTKSAPLYTPSGVPVIPPTDLGLRRVLTQCPTAPREDDEAAGYTPQENEVFGEWVYVPSNGVRGDGKRVWKCYPIIWAWQCRFEVMILDDMITEDVFYQVLEEAGQLIGMGRFRVRNCGTYGRFEVVR